MVQFENVGVRYGTGPEVLSDITFDLPDAHSISLPDPVAPEPSPEADVPCPATQSRADQPVRPNAASYTTDELLAVRRQIGVVFRTSV